MAYYNLSETQSRISKVQKLLSEKGLDIAVIYYDELNIANGWYLTGWCPQFESGAVLVPAEGEPMLLGGPESEPFAKQSSAIKETRNFPVFMVPDEEYPNAEITDFNNLFAELNSRHTVKRAGIVGLAQMPYSVHKQFIEGFKGVEIVDITEEYLKFRHIKSQWEVQQIRAAFKLCDEAYIAMKETIKPGVPEFMVAAAGEAIARKKGASSFAFKTIVGSGERSNAVVPTAMDKIMQSGEMVMLGISPRVNGYSGVFGHTLPVNGEYTVEQAECYKHMLEVMHAVKSQLKPGAVGKEINEAGRKIYERLGYIKYMVCPFAHTIGLMEAEAPFFGPNSDDILVPGMAVCVDVSFFGHPKLHGLRIETGYEITENGAVPFSEFMDNVFFGK